MASKITVLNTNLGNLESRKKQLLPSSVVVLLNYVPRFYINYYGQTLLCTKASSHSMSQALCVIRGGRAVLHGTHTSQ